MVISMENITVNKEFHELHFDSIQALRGLAALFVVFQHVRFLNFGAFGVDIFFCISGFMIMFTTEKSTKYFFRKRLVRILPLYYLMTLGTYLSLLLFPSMFQQTRHDFSYLVKSQEHPSADAIYQDLKPAFPNMSLATVYNNLKVLIEEGFVSEIKVRNDTTTYFDFMGHDHLNLICESCGKIEDIDIEVPDVRAEAREKSGYVITKCQTTVYGLCPECQKKKQ